PPTPRRPGSRPVRPCAGRPAPRRGARRSRRGRRSRRRPTTPGRAGGTRRPPPPSRGGRGSVRPWRRSWVKPSRDDGAGNEVGHGTIPSGVPGSLVGGSSSADPGDAMAASPSLVDLLVILVAAKAVAEVAERVGVPAVVGEMVAGVLVGPSVLGLVAPGPVL